MEHSLHLAAKHFVQAITPASSDSEGASDSDNNDDDNDNQCLDSGDSLAKAIALVKQVGFPCFINACTVVTNAYRFVNPHRRGCSSARPVSNLEFLPSSSCCGSGLDGVLFSSSSSILSVFKLCVLSLLFLVMLLTHVLTGRHSIYPPGRCEYCCAKPH